MLIKNRHPDQLPLFIPDSDWKPPTELVDLRRGAKIIAVDTETHDPLLETHGPGFLRGDAKLCGISLANDLGQKVYLPIGHAEDNMDKELALRYARDMLSGDHEKCGAHLMYDMESLWSEGVEVKGPLADIQIAEPLLDEERPGGYSLGALSRSYLGKTKNEQLLREAGASYGADSEREVKKLAAKMPARFWGPYAEDDATLPIEIYQLQKPKLISEKLEVVFELERQLQRVLFKMHMRGVRVDLKEAEKIRDECVAEEANLYAKLVEMAGKPFDPSSSKELAPILHERGMNVPQTALGNDSVTAPWLESMIKFDSFCELVIRWRRAGKMRRDFIEGLVLDFNVKGRLHPQWHQLREPKNQNDDSSDEVKGGRSGRIMASKPNLTQIPSRDPKWGPKIRNIFIADEGCFWGKKDYSQQEPRIGLHFAYIHNMPGAAEARQRYIDDPSTDYHQMTNDLIKEKTGLDLTRRVAKDINLGSAYEMGEEKMAAKLNIDVEQARDILKTYHAGVPYVRKISRKAMEIVEAQGFIRTYLGRKRRFNMWEPKHRTFGELPLPLEEAREKYKNRELVRARTYRGFNAAVQGSAGDQMKKAIVLLDSEGITPQIQVYDELNNSYSDMATMERARQIMVDALPFEVPHLVEPEIGPSWGKLKKVKE